MKTISSIWLRALPQRLPRSYMLSGFAIVHSIHLVMIVQLMVSLIVLSLKIAGRALTGMVLVDFVFAFNARRASAIYSVFLFFYSIFFWLFHILLKEGFSFRIVQLSMIAAGVIVSHWIERYSTFPTLQLPFISVRAE